MSLGVLNNLSAVYAENNLNSTNSNLSKTLQQLSSGSKINSGADDAAGLSLVDGLQANQTALTQSATNSSEGVGMLQVADGALSQVTSLLNRAVTLATEVSNGTLNSSQGQAANQEYQSSLAAIEHNGATTTYNQQKVFGQATDTTIYTGDSSSQSASVDNLHFSQLNRDSVGDAGGTINYSSGQANTFFDLTGTAAAGYGDAMAAGSLQFTSTLADGSTTTVASVTINAGDTVQESNWRSQRVGYRGHSNLGDRSLGRRRECDSANRYRPGDLGADRGGRSKSRRCRHRANHN